MFRSVDTGLGGGLQQVMAVTLKSLLTLELANRKLRNPAYSLRALSRDLGISLTALSSAMSGHRDLSKKNLEKLALILGLSPQQMLELTGEKNRTDSRRQKENEHLLLAEDEFRLIADWYCLGILNLAKLKSSESSPRWIAARLAITREQASEAIERLTRLGFLQIHGKKMKRTAKPLKTTTDVPSAAIRKHHQQNLILAERALHHLPVERREFSSVTMTANREKLPKVKEILLKTRQKIADLLEDDSSEEVYTLAFQLFPLTHELKKTEKK